MIQQLRYLHENGTNVVNKFGKHIRYVYMPSFFFLYCMCVGKWLQPAKYEIRHFLSIYLRNAQKSISQAQAVDISQDHY
jgi:hypothetical protein